MARDKEATRERAFSGGDVEELAIDNCRDCEEYKVDGEVNGEGSKGRCHLHAISALCVAKVGHERSGSAFAALHSEPQLFKFCEGHRVPSIQEQHDYYYHRQRHRRPIDLVNFIDFFLVFSTTLSKAYPPTLPRPYLGCPGFSLGVYTARHLQFPMKPSSLAFFPTFTLQLPASNTSSFSTLHFPIKLARGLALAPSRTPAALPIRLARGLAPAPSRAPAPLSHVTLP